MARTSLFAALAMALLVASAAVAQQKNDVEIFANVTDTGTLNAGSSIGLSLARLVRPGVSVQLAVATESHDTYAYVVLPGGAIQTVNAQRVRTYPIDLAARYHWENDTPWKPYIGAGVRYVAAPNVSSDFGYASRVNPELVGGIGFLIQPRLSLTLDGRLLVAGNRENYDPLTKVSLGLDWRF